MLTTPKIQMIGEVYFVPDLRCVWFVNCSAGVLKVIFGLDKVENALKAIIRAVYMIFSPIAAHDS
jgi:hypothetical protein